MLQSSKLNSSNVKDVLCLFIGVASVVYEDDVNTCLESFFSGGIEFRETGISGNCGTDRRLGIFLFCSSFWVEINNFGLL